jgi:hypothetical protein
LRKKAAKVKKKRKEMGCEDLPQPAEIIPLATPMASFGKIVWVASNPATGSHNVPPFQSFQRLPDQSQCISP